MTTTTQQLPADPARRLADKILARTNNGQDLIVLLHDISKGGYDASKNDRITATNFLTDRGYGKCPKNQPRTPLNRDGGTRPRTQRNPIITRNHSSDDSPRPPPSPTKNPSPPGSSPKSATPSTNPSDQCPAPTRPEHSVPRRARIPPSQLHLLADSHESPESGGISHSTEH